MDDILRLSKAAIQAAMSSTQMTRATLRLQAAIDNYSGWTSYDDIIEAGEKLISAYTNLAKSYAELLKIDNDEMEGLCNKIAENPEQKEELVPRLLERRETAVRHAQITCRIVKSRQYIQESVDLIVSSYIPGVEQGSGNIDDLAEKIREIWEK